TFTARMTSIPTPVTTPTARRRTGRKARSSATTRMSSRVRPISGTIGMITSVKDTGSVNTSGTSQEACDRFYAGSHHRLHDRGVHAHEDEPERQQAKCKLIFQRHIGDLAVPLLSLKLAEEHPLHNAQDRSEERRVGKECRARCSPYKERKRI